MAKYTREDVIAAAKRVAEEMGASPSRADFERVTGISQYHIYKLFPEGAWSEVKRLAGLDRHPRHKQGLSNEQLLDEFHRVVVLLGKIPTWSAFALEANISSDVVRRRFGGTRGTLAHYRDWLEGNYPNTPFLSDVIARLKDVDLSATATGGGFEGRGGSADVDEPVWGKLAGVEFGSPIDFRGLRYAPINEQGVVFLFGMICYEIGFVVEAIHASYPDCEAMRRVDRRKDRWQRVRVEFEYLSRNFRDHGHDPKDCDLIICWEDNWPECPLEVLALKAVIQELDK